MNLEESSASSVYYPREDSSSISPKATETSFFAVVTI